MKLKLRVPDDDDAFEGGDVDSSDSNVDSGSEDDEGEGRSRSVQARRATRVLSRSRGASMDPDALDAAGETPGASDDASDDHQDLVATPADDEPEPVDLDSDVDPINSGAVTPGVVPVVPTPTEKARSQFAPRRKETKVIKGQTYTVIDDEIQLEDDPRGEAKIDADGNLLGRKYKPNTFTSPLRHNPNKVYMLSIDAARASGFRDSLYFFRRNPLIHKLGCNQQEKDRLIELGKLSANLKSRAVTMVSARNCFKIMGASFVENGRHVFDDYYEDKALAAGHKPGEPAWIETYDPEKDTGTLAAAKGPAPAGATGSGLNTLLGHSGKPRSHQPDLRGGPSGPRDEYTTHIGGPVGAIFGGSGLQPFGKTWDPTAKKAKPAAHLTRENWMEEYAKSVGEANRALGVVRKMNLGQVQVGLGVVEREEDMWIEVEAEQSDDGSGDEGDGRTRRRQAMAVDSPIPLEPSTSADGPPTEPTFLPPHLPIDFSDHHLPLPSSVAPSPHPTPDADGPPPPKKRKLIKVYNPIRGIYDPETNTPHVYASTQPTRSSAWREDPVPHIFPTPEPDEDDMKVENVEERKWHRAWEAAAAHAGVATLTYVVDDDAFGQQEQLLPGLWDFRAIEERWVEGQQ